ncbi:sulfotransferase [Aureimonas phyllosphaerae]|uniref:Sulfotransferase domain-containing protein n=1 Tax=Aureimonas phyllosphaerae TaxID=1166078 RepID=A0A7W6FX02_9HYPH|nr:sulfotransferase [Aureimonas phyllosphaerae]MBB3937547.1 hypothetical protein [Aureimonas phyllosphaerae]MBB3961653.1 hypothetical protein [Aureimonas phyllosphaerae]SFF46337.1 Sulfotransferase domain-containing protein [Aureimonas phyllosphaerae]
MRAQDIDFLIIGAAKSATTWLQKALQADPHVFMPEPELHYFSRYHERGDDWYFRQFEGCRADQIVGEKSNSYLDNPLAPARVQALLPHARLVVQLRNPVERAYSDYCMLYRRGEAGGNIEAELDTRTGRGNRFLNGGLYHDQLTAYLDLYPQDQLLVLFYEDMLADPGRQLAKVRAHLGLLEADPRSVDVKKVKDRTEPMVGRGLRRALGPIKPLVRPFRRHPLFVAARKRLIGEVAYPALSSSLRARLVDYYEPDVARLGNLIQADLSGWLGRAGRGTSFE